LLASPRPSFGEDGTERKVGSEGEEEGEERENEGEGGGEVWLERGLGMMRLSKERIDSEVKEDMVGCG
jgi:hypothetical protein